MDHHGPACFAKRVRDILLALVIINGGAIFFLARDIQPGDVYTIRLIAGIFLLLFVCLHGWFRYGWPAMVMFFCITAAITWSVESISIATGFPFGSFHYSNTLGEKIGEVPLMILPAYFFNGYLAWTMAGLLTGGEGPALNRKQLVLVPALAALFMVFWNMSFEPVMSTIEGHWTWAGGIWHGVPITNFAGWFLTSLLFFLGFALFFKKAGHQFNATRENPLDPSHWYLFPAMYAVQCMPGLLHAIFRSGHGEIYLSVAMATALTMIPAVTVTFIVINRRFRQMCRRKNYASKN